MFSFLKDHPFAVEAFFKHSIVLTFAVKKKNLENLIPECLELDVFENNYGFIAVAMVQTESLRPKGFPKVFGNNFYLIGYRVFVKYKNNVGKKRRGLYILKSETDKNRMTFFGNIFTHYNYSTTDIFQEETDKIGRIRSEKSNFEILFHSNESEVNLPSNSPFKDWKEARRFAGPLPFTFTYNIKKNEVLTIEGIRKNWKPKPIEVLKYNISFLDNLNLENPILANAFEIENIPYYWKKGKTEKWIK